MKFVALLLLLAFSNCLYAKPTMTPTHISCADASEGDYKLEIEVDIFESLPPQSLVKLYRDDYLLVEARAIRQVIPLKSRLPQTVYVFTFVENIGYDFLRVNLTSESADIALINVKGKGTGVSSKINH